MNKQQEDDRNMLLDAQQQHDALMKVPSQKA
jgi:hypothetical protein